MASRIEEKQRAREAREAAEQAQARSARRRTALLRLGLVLALAVVVVVVAIVLSSGGDDKTASSGSGSGDAKAVSALYQGIPQGGITLGDPKAKATLIEFADLQCPFCAEYSRQAMPIVVKNYVRSGKLRYQLRLRSFLGDDSVKAAGAAAAATKANKLFQFADLFYRRQGDENSGYVTDAFIRSLARDTGADPAAAVKAAGDASNQPLVQAAEKQATDLGSQSTPDFFLRLASGRLVKVAPQDLTADAFTEALDQALAQT